MKNYSFISFSKSNFTTSDDYIGITKNKVITFSKSFLLKNHFLPEEMRFVDFGYDPISIAISLQFRKEKGLNSFTLVYDKRGHGGANVSCGTFLKNFKIDVNKYSGRYPYIVIKTSKEVDIYVVDLKPKLNES